ncbi:hypothetical protein [Streptomyces xinghaiensis]|uniref:hypothetical protein n=1 Tax=Streptomyces xinghaiensis TaxID=1038928 RepID=UPI0002D9CD4E|nr:hypothetical protein [Streptomyces xinghaiensis]MZE76299.1 hypothetical protein [Streptomyces sp. SID5475]
MDLPERIAAVRAGNGEPAAMAGEFRRTAVLLHWDPDVDRSQWNFASHHRPTRPAGPPLREYLPVRE